MKHLPVEQKHGIFRSSTATQYQNTQLYYSSHSKVMSRDMKIQQYLPTSVYTPNMIKYRLHTCKYHRIKKSHDVIADEFDFNFHLPPSNPLKKANTHTYLHFNSHILGKRGSAVNLTTFIRKRLNNRNNNNKQRSLRPLSCI